MRHGPISNPQNVKYSYLVHGESKVVDCQALLLTFGECLDKALEMLVGLCMPCTVVTATVLTIDRRHTRILCTDQTERACRQCPCCKGSSIQICHCNTGLRLLAFLEDTERAGLTRGGGWKGDRMSI